MLVPGPHTVFAQAGRYSFQILPYLTLGIASVNVKPMNSSSSDLVFDFGSIRGITLAFAKLNFFNALLTGMAVPPGNTFISLHLSHILFTNCVLDNNMTNLLEVPGGARWTFINGTGNATFANSKITNMAVATLFIGNKLRLESSVVVNNQFQLAIALVFEAADTRISCTNQLRLPTPFIVTNTSATITNSSFENMVVRGSLLWAIEGQVATVDIDKTKFIRLTTLNHARQLIIIDAGKLTIANTQFTSNFKCTHLIRSQLIQQGEKSVD